MRKKRFQKICATTLIAGMVSMSWMTSAFAHQGFTQTANPIVSIGDTAYTELLFGNHSNEHKSYRIDGNWGSTAHQSFVYTPDGQKVNISSTEYFMGEVGPTFVNQNKNNSYYVSFAGQLPGAYVVNVESDTVYKGSSGAKRTVRSAKSFVAVSDLTAVQRVGNLKGFQKAVTTDRAELVPQFNPVATFRGTTLRVQLLLKGAPLADTVVDVIRRSTKDAQELKSDANGMIEFIAGPVDFYLVAAKPEMPTEKIAGEYDSTAYEATMTFQVIKKPFLFTPSNGAKVTESEKVPDVFLDGRKLKSEGLVLENGTWHVPQALAASWFGKKTTVPKKKNVKTKTPTVTLISLQELLKQNELIAEELAPVGPIPATLLLQTKIKK